MKKTIKLMATLLTTCIMILPAAAKELRTLKGTADKIKDIKTARKIAENYQLKIIYDSAKEVGTIKLPMFGTGYHFTYEEDGKTIKSLSKPFPGTSLDAYEKELFVAQNEENGETVVYMQTFTESFLKSKNIFSYSFLNNNATSNIRLKTDGGELSFKNTDESVGQTNSVLVVQGAPASTSVMCTKWLASMRMAYKEILFKWYNIDFKDEINENQVKIVDFDDFEGVTYLKVEKELSAQKAKEREAQKAAEKANKQNTTANATTTKTNNKNSLKQENELKWVPADWKLDSNYPEDAQNYWSTTNTSWTVFHASDPTWLKVTGTCDMKTNEPLYGFEAVVKKTKGSQDLGFGIIFGSPRGPTDGYKVTIKTTGEYCIEEMSNNISTKLTAWDYLDGVKTGLNVEHKIKCQLVNENKDWEIYINDDLVYTIKDSKYKAGKVFLLSNIILSKFSKEKPMENQYKLLQFYK